MIATSVAIFLVSKIPNKHELKKNLLKRHKQWLAYLLPDPASLGWFPVFTKNSEKTIVTVAEVNQRPCLEESEQRLENVD